MSEGLHKLDMIRLAGLTVHCIIGVYPSERRTPQPLSVEVALFLAPTGAPRGGLSETVDYAKVAAELRFLLESSHFLLLETAAEAICAYLLAPPTDDAPRATIEAVRLTLEKPAALSAVRPSLTVTRQRGAYDYGHEQKPFGSVDIVYETRDCGIYRLRIGAGQSIPTHVHRIMDEREMLLSSGLLLQGQAQPAGAVVSWPHDLPHRYDNPTDIERTVLCVDRPRFMPDDEIEVDEPVNPVRVLRYYPAETD